ncbi:hypothetical protein ACJIZ3_025223 [Penstemon smallii]|uniref:RING-type E3 ubiquitin transferase n=1 Tax=Penstemon smallii TaxID=265156 RepID=A0ABD3TU72_9LAMI
MSWVLLEIKERTFLSPIQQPNFQFHPPPPPLQSNGFNLNKSVSSSTLLIIIILAIIFFISGLLHLLVRFLLRPPNRDTDETDSVTALQGQLQQLFHLHDSGVDQSFIDRLPVFNYKAIIGAKDPFDCAVCLCEFEAEDKLRLLPKCSHAFHMNCIDTWLLSHSTCPLCRANLLLDFTPNSNCSPIVLVLESGGSESNREISSEVGLGITRVNSHLSDFDDFRLHYEDDPLQKSNEIQEKEREKVVSIKLGKFRNVDNGCEGEGSNIESNAETRRCFSMGSFAYIMDENSSLQVPIRTTPMKKQSSKNGSLPNRPAMSECGCGDSRREFNGLDAFKILERANDDSKSIGRSKRESFSVSKIWLRGKKDKASEATMESSRRAFSFRLPAHENRVASEEMKPKNGCGVGGSRRTISEINIGSDLGFDEEAQSFNSLDSQTNPPSFGRRTLLWYLRGRQNKVVNSSFSTNV